MRYIEVKTCTPNLLIINQLQNGFVERGPHAFFLDRSYFFAFLVYFYKLIEKLYKVNTAINR